jgi:hypothetical protein
MKYNPGRANSLLSIGNEEAACSNQLKRVLSGESQWSYKNRGKRKHRDRAFTREFNVLVRFEDSCANSVS